MPLWIICEERGINMNTTIKFAKVRPDAIIPTKRVEDAGFDIYANFEEQYMIIDAHTTVMIPTGIASCCDEGYCLIAKERGSTGTKGLAQRAGVIDSGYRNEILIPLTNTTEHDIVIAKHGITLGEIFHEHATKNANDFEFLTLMLEGLDTPEGWQKYAERSNIIIYPYEKAIAQLLVVPVPEVEVEEITYEELQAIPSQRGMGRLGSSGK